MEACRAGSASSAVEQKLRTAPSPRLGTPTLLVFALLAGCANPAEILILEADSEARNTIERMRGVRPTAPLRMVDTKAVAKGQAFFSLKTGAVHVNVDCVDPEAYEERRWTGALLVHELTHALQAQRGALDNGGTLADVARSPDPDAAWVRRVVIEGEAELAALFHVTRQGSRRGLTRAGEVFAKDREDAGYLRIAAAQVRRVNSLQFSLPYREGLRVALEHYLTGGWAAVERLVRDPPARSASIILGSGHPFGAWRTRPPAGVTLQSLGAANALTYLAAAVANRGEDNGEAVEVARSILAASRAAARLEVPLQPSSALGTLLRARTRTTLKNADERARRAGLQVLREGTLLLLLGEPLPAAHVVQVQVVLRALAQRER